MRYSGRSVRLTTGPRLSLCRLCVASVRVLSPPPPPPPPPPTPPPPPRLDAIRHSRLPTKGNLSPAQPKSHISYVFPFYSFIPSSILPFPTIFKIFNRCSVLVAVAPQHHRPPRTPELPSGAPTASPTSPHHALSVSSLAPRSCAILYAISVTHRRTGQPRKHTHPEYIICLGTALG